MRHLVSRWRLARPSNLPQPRFHCAPPPPPPPSNSKLFVGGLIGFNSFGFTFLCVFVAVHDDSFALDWIKVCRGLWMRCLSRMPSLPLEMSPKVRVFTPFSLF